MDFKQACKKYVGDEKTVKELQSKIANLSKKDKEDLIKITKKLNDFFGKNIAVVMKITNGFHVSIPLLNDNFTQRFFEKKKENETFYRDYLGIPYEGEKIELQQKSDNEERMAAKEKTWLQYEQEPEDFLEI